MGQELEPDEEVDTSDDLPMLNIQMVKPTLSQSGVFLDLHVEGKPVKMELDTGASVSIISEKTWQEDFGAPQLTKCAIKLRTYTGQNMKVRGQKLVRVKYGNQECQLPLLVVAGKGPSLFGQNWLGWTGKVSNRSGPRWRSCCRSSRRCSGLSWALFVVCRLP